MYTYIYIYTYICISIYVYIYMFTFMSMSMYMYMYMYTYTVYAYVFIHMDFFIATHAKSLLMLHSNVLFPCDVLLLLGVLYRIDPDEQEDDKAMVGVGETSDELHIAAWTGFCYSSCVLIRVIYTRCYGLMMLALSCTLYF